MCPYALLRITLVLLSIHSSVIGAPNQDDSRWLAAIHTATGKVVQVRLAGDVTVDGTLVGGSESSLILRDRRGETTVARSDVRRVRMRTGRSRGRRMLRGALLGGAVGVGVATAATLVTRTAIENEGGNTGILIPIGIGVAATGAGIGMAIGAALPVHYQTIFEVP